MGKIDPDAAPRRDGTGYPPPHEAPCREGRRRKLGAAAGLTQFGVNRLVLAPGGWSSQRHWHSTEDEFVWVLEGEMVLVTGAGETVLRAGDCAGFRAGDPADAHHLQNRSDRDAVILEVGARRPGEDTVTYPDVDLHLPPDGRYRHSDGTPY